jgi:hypothetical protein
MGYSTQFVGEFKVDRPVDTETYNLLVGLATTRRMKRRVDAKYGVDGEFYVEDDDEGVVDNNRTPSTQPSLWCQWLIDDDRQTISWDGGEKFYDYVEWIKYIADRVLKPRGYKLSGEVEWQGEDARDIGIIVVTENEVTTKKGRVVFS